MREPMQWMYRVAIGLEPEATVKDRQEAIRFLTERGYGKALETHVVGAMSEDAREAAAELTRDQLLSLVGSSAPGAIGSGPTPAALSGPRTGPVPSELLKDAGHKD